MCSKTVPVVEKIMDANEQVALENRKKLDEAGVFAINIMASPGAGKTSTILKTIEHLADKYNIAVIEGDTAPVTIDSDKVKAKGIPAVQINTGGSCHLNAPLLTVGLNALDLSDLDLVIIENVGNLVCPAGVALGSHANVVIASVPEGDDKPYKYPQIYRGIDVIVLNKIDLMPYIDFNMQYFLDGLEMLNPGLQNFPLSAKTDEGVEAWTNWIADQIESRRSK
ncbi:MAG: hydrogenase nickel incorporation protein HypB [Anaerolineaceae bacterium]|nr:hydrogenase nickel incorporation protein HypB [Anaerolineaceae bacterium]